MKYTILLLLAFSICLAQIPDNMDIIDSIKADPNLNLELDKMNVSVDNLGNVNNDSIFFDKVKDFSSIFLNFINALVTVIVLWLTIVVPRHKKGIEETLKKDREKNQDNFNAAYKKIAEVYYIFARDELTHIKEGKKEEYKDEHWYRHFIYLGDFYFSLSKMNVFSDNELFLMQLTKKFFDTYRDYKDKGMPVPDIKFFYHFLPFIEYSEKINKAMHNEAKDIYHGLLEIIDYDKIKESFNKSNWVKERIQKTLILAERYKDRGPKDILGIAKKI